MSAWLNVKRVSAVKPPISQPNIKQHLRVDGPDEDFLIDEYLHSAVELIENENGIALLQQDFDLFFEHFPGAEIQFPIGPLASVTTLKYIDSDGNQQTWAASNYEVDTVNGRLRPLSSIAWPSTKYVFNAVEIRFVAGWTAALVPSAIKQAVRLTTAHNFENREAVDAGMTRTWSTEIPLGVQRLLDPYRRGRFGA